MDIDWCLTCSRHIEEGTGPYCSLDCAQPSHFHPSSSNSPSFQHEQFYEEDEDDNDAYDQIFYHFNPDAVPAHYWAGNGLAGISNWLANVPVGPPLSLATDSPLSTSPSPSPSTSNHPAPKLLNLHRRPIPPTLCMSAPKAVQPSPSLPVVTPKQHFANLSASQLGDYGTSKASLLSGATESSIATPASAHPVPISPDQPTMFGAIATHVRSWVSPSSQIRCPSFHIAESQKRQIHPSLLIHSSRSSLTGSSSEEHDATPIWLIANSPAQVTVKSKQSGEPPRGRYPSLGDSHPSYRSRGRKVSRAAA